MKLSKNKCFRILQNIRIPTHMRTHVNTHIYICTLKIKSKASKILDEWPSTEDASSVPHKYPLKGTPPIVKVLKEISMQTWGRWEVVTMQAWGLESDPQWLTCNSTLGRLLETGDSQSKLAIIISYVGFIERFLIGKVEENDSHQLRPPHVLPHTCKNTYTFIHTTHNENGRNQNKKMTISL